MCSHLFARLLFAVALTRLLAAHSDNGVTFNSVSMMQRDEVKRNRLKTTIWPHPPNAHIANRKHPPPPPRPQSSESAQWNSNHKHKPSRTNQRHTKWSLKWPLLSNPLGDDLWNVKERNQKPDLKLLNRTLCKSIQDYCMCSILCLKSTVSGVCVCVCVYLCPVHKQVYGLLSRACKNQNRSPGMSASVSSCTGLSCVIFVKIGMRGREANRNHEVFFFFFLPRGIYGRLE